MSLSGETLHHGDSINLMKTLFELVSAHLDTYAMYHDTLSAIETHGRRIKVLL